MASSYTRRAQSFVGFLTDNPIWDLAGLITPSVARARHDRGEEAQRLMCEELLALQPAYILLRWRSGPLAVVPKRIDQCLQDDPRTKVLYRRRGGGPLSDRIIYTRKKMARVDLEERVDAAIRGFPEYKLRARELLDR